MTTQFDPITYVQDLEAAGVPKVQAEVHAKALAHVVNECVVLPDHLAQTEMRLRSEIHDVETRLSGKIDILRIELKGMISESENRLKGLISESEIKMKGLIDESEIKTKGEFDKLRVELAFVRRMIAVTWALLVGLYLQLLFM